MLKFVELDKKGLNTLREWFQDEETKKRIAISSLGQWFEYVQSDPNYFAWLAFDNEQAVGQVSLEINEDEFGYVSILTNPMLRNKGYGKRMLKTLQQKFATSSLQKIIAGIEEDNIASIRCFQSAGFKNKGKDEDGLLEFTFDFTNVK